MFLIRAVTIVVPGAITILLGQDMWNFVFSKESFGIIRRFRILDYLDLRKNSRHLYDVSCVRRVSNGHKVVVRESDLYLHWLVSGATGAGKTSMMLLKMIYQILIRRVRNEDALRKEIDKGLKKGIFKLTGTIDEDHPDLSCVTGADEKATKKIKKLAKKYSLAGLTMIAPDDSGTDEVYDLCMALGIKCNRIDPIRIEKTGMLKEGFVGYNPLYLSPDIPDWKKEDEIISVASRVSDVVFSISRSLGKSEFYFTSIIYDLLKATITCLMVTMPIIKDRQATLEDVQAIVTDFSLIHDYAAELERICRKSKQKGFQKVVNTINRTFLGNEKDKIYEHSRGLRLLLDLIINTNKVREILCPSDDKSLDLDKALRDGEVTVINFGLEMGDTDSRSLGLIMLLSFIDAVLRRPRAEGISISPHFLIVDELPVIVCKSFERALSLFRKYHVGIVGCIQSLSQFDKDSSTAYLKTAILNGCAHHTIFGRCTVEEMRIYSELAGIKWEEDELETLTETDKDTGEYVVSSSKKESLQKVNALEGTDIRNSMFGEVTQITVRNGNLYPPIAGKVDFLSKWKRRKIRRPKYDWSDYVTIGSGVKNMLNKKEEPEPDGDNFKDQEDYRKSIFDYYAHHQDPDNAEDIKKIYNENPNSGSITI
jgi:hypothetical protein